jgi:hypothetical protein
MNWIMENLSSILVGLALALLFAMAIRSMLKGKKTGGSCAGCPSAGTCARFRAAEEGNEPEDSAKTQTGKTA